MLIFIQYSHTMSTCNHYKTNITFRQQQHFILKERKNYLWKSLFKFLTHGSWIMTNGSWITDNGFLIMNHWSWLWIMDHRLWWIMDHDYIQYPGTYILYLGSFFCFRDSMSCICILLSQILYPAIPNPVSEILDFVS